MTRKLLPELFPPADKGGRIHAEMARGFPHGMVFVVSHGEVFVLRPFKQGLQIHILPLAKAGGLEAGGEEREIVGRDDRTVAHDEGALHNVLQFPHIARPRIVAQAFQGGGRKGFALAVFSVQPLQGVAGDGGDIVSAFPQRNDQGKTFNR